MRFVFVFSLALLAASAVWAQQPVSTKTIEYSAPSEYRINRIDVRSNSSKIDKQGVIIISGLNPGSTIKVPGEEISSAIEKLWESKVFTNIRVYASKMERGEVDLVIYVEEKDRLSNFKFKGLRKSEEDDIREQIKWMRGEVLTDHMLMSAEDRIRDYLVDKGYLSPDINMIFTPDTTVMVNAVKVEIQVKKNEKGKVNRMEILGNTVVKTSLIRRKMKDAIVEKSRVDVGHDILKLFKKKGTFQKADSTMLTDGFWESAVEYFRNSVRVNVLKSSKYVEAEWDNALSSVIKVYNAKGYRDARFVKDSVYFKDGELNVKLEISEGRKYYFRNINWVGNKRYRTGQLDSILSIKKGDVYDQDMLEQKLRFNSNGIDISALYQDIGYLFFNIDPVETAVVGDSIDIEIRIYEGKQARINRIFITGNSKTNDHVILRELRTKPGQLFSRSDIIRSQQALSQLGYFDPQNMDVRPIPNPVDGTVDLEYVVAEAPSDQIELSGGWGANQIVGTLGLTFNNFSIKNMFKKGAWTPLPSGDGQKLSLRVQSNGPTYQAYNFSFTEPWLGGKKPISLSFFVSHTSFGGLDTNSTRLSTTSVGVSLGKQLKWPDDYFSTLFSVSYHRYNARNYNLFNSLGNASFTGVSNNISFSATITRNSTNDWIFPTSGSNISASVDFTPPYSLISGKDFTNRPLSEKYEWLEYHKWKFKAQWFVPLTKKEKFVMMARAEFGFLGMYNGQIGLTPFERFFLGGDGLVGFNIDGRDIIALRGYNNSALTPGYNGNQSNAYGGTVYSKYTVEFRYLISPNPQAKIFALTFLEAGNSWENFENFSPFQVNRSAGVGVRIFLPMFGLLGVDYGWGFDPVRGVPESARPSGVFHFMIGQQF